MEAILKNRLLNLIIKTLVTTALIFVLYYEITHHNNLKEVWTLFLNSFSIQNIPYLIIVILLMPFNWALETEKWRVLIRDFEPISFLKAYKMAL